MSAVIKADPERVWRALTDPDELCAWDDNLLAAVDLSSAYPNVDSPQRWRYLLGGIQVLLHERPVEVEVPRRLHSVLSMGGMRLEQTYTLACESDALTIATLQRIQELRECWVGGATWHGRAVIRVSVSSWATTEQDITRSVASFESALADVNTRPA